MRSTALALIRVLYINHKVVRLANINLHFLVWCPVLLGLCVSEQDFKRWL